MASNSRPQHEALAAAKLTGGAGGGGTTDYSDLTNKPQINGVTLNGNKSSEDIGITEPWVGTSAEYTEAAAAGTIPAGTPVVVTDDMDIDAVPTDGSTNPVESNGVYDALAGKQAVIDSSHKLSADLVDDSSATNKFVTAADKTSIGTSATKLTGISSSATNYVQLTNGLRLYVSNTEPTGNDIPEGSVWIGGTVSS